MVGDDVEAAAIAVVRAQFGSMPVGQDCQLAQFLGTGRQSESVERAGGRGGPLARDRIVQGRVRGEKVDVRERRNLVRHVMGREAVAHAPTVSWATTFKHIATLKSRQLGRPVEGRLPTSE